MINTEQKNSILCVFFYRTKRYLSLLNALNVPKYWSASANYKSILRVLKSNFSSLICVCGSSWKYTPSVCLQNTLRWARVKMTTKRDRVYKEIDMAAYTISVFYDKIECFCVWGRRICIYMCIYMRNVVYSIV